MIETKLKTEIFKSFLEIDEDSKIPKYRQLVDLFLNDIEIGLVKIGERIPSINETSEEFYLSRDTVVKAYELLRNKGIITAVKGKGFYVASTSPKQGKKILVLFNNLGDHKKTIFNSFVKNLSEDCTVDLQVHNCDSATLEKMIIENLGKYDYYVIMPHLIEETESVRVAINKIPKDRLVFVNKDLDHIDNQCSCVYEDFERDIYEGLSLGLSDIIKYEGLHLIFPPEKLYCMGIKYGMIRFCDEHDLDWDISDSANVDVQPGTLYVVVEDDDLVEIIKEATTKNLALGTDIGIISYNDTPFKEILAGGISVLSTDFQHMGKTIAEMVLHKTIGKQKNPYSFIKRNSI
jgi:DNA-binding transcriptional regulator YhcF (GntR family)